MANKDKCEFHKIPYLVSDSDFEQFVNSTNHQCTVLHFTAPWSEACKQMHTVLETIASDADVYNKISFAEVEAESVPKISLRFGIKAVPTFIFIKNETEFDRVDGAHAAELTKKIRQCSAGFQVTKMPPKLSVKPETEEELNERLKVLVNSHKCIIFMKGSPEQPKCGFSRQLVDILNGLNVDYETFDILEDETVRQGLKKFSNWPTFPQVYVDGELIGGLDIIKEMQALGELETTLPVKRSLQERLKSLINRAPLMVFMKGGKASPRCKFSKALMSILIDEIKLDFDTFDILEDEEVRQELKKYSNWPTYPQIYVNGELIGGIDIVQEMKESGELKKALNVQ